MYEICGYYGSNYSGLGDSYTTDNWSEAEEYAHSYLSDGYYVTIRNTQSGKSVRINPDEYFDGFEGEFPTEIAREVK